MWGVYIGYPQPQETCTTSLEPFKLVWVSWAFWKSKSLTKTSEPREALPGRIIEKVPNKTTISA